MPQELANTELSPADIPSYKEPWSRIEPFALTFDGYKYWGSVERCAEVAAKSPGTLTELRTHLFYEARRWSHLKKSPDAAAMKRVGALLFAISQKVRAGDLR